MCCVSTLQLSLPLSAGRKMVPHMHIFLLPRIKDGFSLLLVLLVMNNDVWSGITDVMMIRNNFQTLRYVRNVNTSMTSVSIQQKQTFISFKSSFFVLFQRQTFLETFSESLRSQPHLSVSGEGLDTGLEQLCQLIARRRKLAKRKRNKTK